MHRRWSCGSLSRCLPDILTLHEFWRCGIAGSVASDAVTTASPLCAALWSFWVCICNYYVETFSWYLVSILVYLKKVQLQRLNFWTVHLIFGFPIKLLENSLFTLNYSLGWDRSVSVYFISFAYFIWLVLEVWFWFYEKVLYRFPLSVSRHAQRSAWY